MKKPILDDYQGEFSPINYHLAYAGLKIASGQDPVIDESVAYFVFDRGLIVQLAHDGISTRARIQRTNSFIPKEVRKTFENAGLEKVAKFKEPSRGQLIMGEGLVEAFP